MFFEKVINEEQYEAGCFILWVGEVNAQTLERRWLSGFVFSGKYSCQNLKSSSNNSLKIGFCLYIILQNKRYLEI